MRTALVTALMAVLSLLAGCGRDDTILYGYKTLGTVSGEAIIGDNGIVYGVQEQTCAGRLDTMHRVMASFDILRRTGDKSYGIRLLDMQPVLCKNTAALSETDGESVGNDPIQAVACWSGNGYLNFVIRIAVLNGSDTRHFINLVHDDTAASADTLYFSLRHNAYGEFFGADGTDGSKFITGTSYVSFKAGDLVPEGRKSMPARISWQWYDSADNSLAGELRTFSAVTELRRAL